MPGGAFDGDLHRLLDVEAVITHAPPPAAGLPEQVLQRLALLIPCEVVSFCDFDPATEVTHLVQDCVDATVTATIGTAPLPGDPFFRYYWTTPVCSYPSRSGDHRSVVMRSDFATDRQWRNSPMYQQKFRVDGLDHTMLCCVHTSRTRTQRVVFFRAGKSFTEHERLLVSLLRPHLADALPTEPAPNRLPLTKRQQELLRLAATGLTNADIATRLHLSPHTVRKHLENTYQRLHVTTRTAAIAHAFPELSP